MNARVGVVVIGRNEGDRLVRCLRSVIGTADAVVYVDSGSTDGSVEAAKNLGAEVVELDRSCLFTAARGRNAGFASLTSSRPSLELVQWVDGDCEVAPRWLERAAGFLEATPRAAAVFGRLRERFPERSLYNRLCELEWDEPPLGEVAACGGIAMMRMAAVRECGGFREDLIAGEEPELCIRLRSRAWSIHRIDAEMALHDAAMDRIGQWWRRAVRFGHAAAETAWLHRHTLGRPGLRSTASAVLWGLVLPVAALAGAPLTGGWSLLAFLLYPVQWARLTARHAARGYGGGLAWRHAGLTIIAKFAHVAGIVRFAGRLLTRRPARLIEYKGPPTEARVIDAAGVPAGVEGRP